jgi:hypothetical protein
MGPAIEDGEEITPLRAAELLVSAERYIALGLRMQTRADAREEAKAYYAERKAKRAANS